MKSKMMYGFAVLGFLGTLEPLHATHSCTSPLVLDLDGDGRILTSGVEYSVEFDINGDGEPDRMGWTSLDATDGFLWLDLNSNGVVDDGGELFGSSTRLPDGGFAAHGFEALGVYDRDSLGGNADGRISPLDSVWRELRTWVDANHDGYSQHEEIRPLGAHRITAIGLEFRTVDRIDGHLNLHAFSGEFSVRGLPGSSARLRRLLVEDIFFVLAGDWSPQN